MKSYIYLTLVNLMLTGCYSTEEFKGGEITDEGLFSYPRYKAKLGNIPLDKEGNYKFVFSGLPNEEMWLQMYVAGKTDSDRDTLENLSTHIKADIRTKNDKEICSASGRPLGKSTDRWTLMSSRMETAFWHSNCLNLPINKTTEYQLNIKISEIDKNTPEVMLNIMLEGGGIELP